MRSAVIASAARTAIGSIGGSLATVPAPQLGGAAIRAAVARAGGSLKAEDVNECIFGNVLQAGIGQAPARQAALDGGLSLHTPSTTINKVCASGMKSVMTASSQIMIGHADCVVAGGMESMSLTPYYLPGMRFGGRYGHSQNLDGIVKDGLWDVYNDFHMGMCGEHCASEHGITREEQDAFAAESYSRAAAAIEAGKFDAEIAAVTIKARGKETVVDKDEEVGRYNASKLTALKPAFKKDGTVTAINASSLNDGAAALLLMSEEFADGKDVKPLAKVLGFGDYAHEPINFTTAPAYAIPIALERAGVKKEDIDRWEINEAFSVVSLINNRLLDLDAAKVNPDGGAVALGHPIGASGARIITTLVHGLEPGQLGCAAICNGGGGASAIVIQKL